MNHTFLIVSLLFLFQVGCVFKSLDAQLLYSASDIFSKIETVRDLLAKGA